MQIALQLPEAEVSFHGQMADLEWTLARVKDNEWIMTIRFLVFENEQGERLLEAEHRTQNFTLNNAQAASTLALMIDGDEPFVANDEVGRVLYEHAEQVWKDVPLIVRPIP